MNVKYGIVRNVENGEMLIKFNKQLNSFLGKNINEMVSLFNRNIKNILADSIPNETISF